MLRELFKETIGIYLGFGVPKNHLGDYVQPTCMSKRFLKVGNMWELFRELLKVDSYFKRGYIGQNQKICCTCKNQGDPPKKI